MNLDEWLQLLVIFATILPFLYALHRQNINRLDKHEKRTRKAMQQIKMIKRQLRIIVLRGSHDVGQD